MNNVPIQLLVVDDDPICAAFVLHLLGKLDAELACAPVWVATAEKALEEMQAKAYDLVLLDYKLPGTDGLDVLSRVHSLPAAIQPAVIMLTGSGSEMVAVEAMKRGAKDYLPKNGLDLPPLTRAITSALAQKRLEARIAQYTEELRQKNEQMQADLDLAREFQLAFLPRRFPAFPRGATDEQSRIRFYHRYQPSGSVGGDFYSVLSLSDSQAAVFVCDVMGHGLRAALVTAIVRGLIEEARPLASNPGRFMTEINRTLAGILQQTDSTVFASAFYLVADVEHGRFRYTNAGHPCPLHVQRRAGRTVALTCCQNFHGPVLGLVEESTYQTSECTATPGDIILLYTDGIYEATAPDGEEYGQERLRRAAQSHSELAADPLLQGLLDDVQRFSGGAGFSDDVCLVGVEVRQVGSNV